MLAFVRQEDLDAYLTALVEGVYICIHTSRESQNIPTGMCNVALVWAIFQIYCDRFYKYCSHGKLLVFS